MMLKGLARSRPDHALGVLLLEQGAGDQSGQLQQLVVAGTWYS